LRGLSPFLYLGGARDEADKRLRGGKVFKGNLPSSLRRGRTESGTSFRCGKAVIHMRERRVRLSLSEDKKREEKIGEGGKRVPGCLD